MMINYQLWGTKSSIFPYRSIFHTKSQQQQGVSIKNIKASSKKQSLVGGLEHGFSDFPFSRDFHHPNLPFTPSFFRFFATQHRQVQQVRRDAMAVAPLELRWLRLLLAWRAVEAVVFSPQVEPELQEAMGGGIWDAFIVIVTYHIILYIYNI